MGGMQLYSVIVTRDTEIDVYKRQGRYRIHQLFEESSVSRIRYAVRTLARSGMKTEKYIWYTHTQEVVPD